MSRDNLEKLIKNLRLENTRSYLLNAVTNGKNSKKLDLALVDELRPGSVSTFLNDLLEKGKASLEINVNDLKNDLKSYEKGHRLIQLFGLQNKYRDNEIRDFGINSQQLGFPLVSRTVKGERGKVILAPLIIWKANTSLSSDLSKIQISVDGSDGAILNQALLSFQATMGEMEPVFYNTDGLIPEGEVLKKKQLDTYLRQIKNGISYFNAEHSDDLTVLEGKQLRKVPARKADIVKLEKDIPVEYRFYYSAVIGLFKSTKESIIKDLRAYLDNLDTLNFDSDELGLDKVSPFNLDPSQLTTYDVLSSSRNLVIHGPPGTGKSTVLSGIIASALKQHKKILFVCEKITALEIIKEKLLEKGLDKEVVLITDLVNDKKSVLNQARSLLEVNSGGHVFNEAVARSEYNRYKDKHAQHIKGLNHRYLFDWDFKKTCGKRIALKREGVTCPKFSSEFLSEFERIGEISLNHLKEAEATLKDVPCYIAYFHFFGITEERNVGGAEARSLDLSKRLENLLQSYIQSKNQATERVKEYLEEELTKYIHTLKEVNFHSNVLKDRHKELEIYFGEGVIQKSIRKVLSKKYKKTIDSIESLIQITEREQPRLEVNIQLPETLLALIEKKIGTFRSQFLMLESEDGQLKLIETYFSADYKGLVSLMKEWSDIFEENKLNRQYNVLSEAARETVSAGKTVVANLNHLNTYNDFLSLLQELNIHRFQSDIELLLTNDQWAQQVEVALLNNALTKSSVDSYTKLHTNDRGFNRLTDRYDELVSNDSKSLRYALQSNRETFIEKFSRERNISLHQLFTVSRKASRNNLLNLFSDYRDLMVHMFPLILTTPNESSAMFRGIEKYFDLVIFDEASQLTIEDSFASLLKAKKVIISGDEYQMPPSKYFIGEAESDYEDELEEEEYWNLQQFMSESLLNFGINDKRNFNSTHLDFHYRSFHHKLIDFSNAAFYKRLIPIPQKYDYKPIDFVQVNGFFEDGVNIGEALKVIAVIESLSSDFIEQNSIGVATLNAKQQKVIWSLMDEKAEEDVRFRVLKSKLDEKGFFVKNLENLQGDERDLIILSVTYGPSGPDKFTRSFGMLNRATGHRLLNVLITRARKRMIVLNSIPPKEYLAYNELRVVKGNTGSAIFYAYLAYARAVSEENIEEEANILANLRTESSYDHSRHTELESPFEEEVYEMLRGEFMEGEITIAEPDSGFRIDMVIRPSGYPGLKIAVECDGAAYHSGYANHFADIHRQRILEGSGYQFVRIWGKSWYLNSEKEFQGLMIKLKKIIDSYETDISQPSFIQAFDLKELEADNDLSHVEVTEEVIQEALADKDLARPEEPLLVVQNHNVISLGMSVELQVLNKNGGRYSYTIAEKSDNIKKKLGINTALVTAIRRHKVGDEFDIDQFRYKLLSLN